MKKLFVFLMSLLIFVFIENVCFAVSNDSITINVSPYGDDSADGSETRPLKTLEGARKAVRQFEKGKKEIRVIFHEGDYKFDKPVTFDYADAGTAWAKVYYEAAEGENVIFSGSKKIDIKDFEPITDNTVLQRLPKVSREKVLELDLKKQGIDKIKDIDLISNPTEVLSDVSLFLNGKKQLLSQWPNGRYNFTSYSKVFDAKSSFVINNVEPFRWNTAKDWYLFGFFNTEYAYDKAMGKSVDASNDILTLIGVNLSDISSKRYQAFNLLEEIDVATEWYIDRKNMVLYYFPPYGLTDSDELELSLYESPFIIASSRDWRRKDSMNITFKGIEFTKNLGDAVRITADNVCFTDCTFSYIGLSAITLSGENIDITDSRFLHVNKYTVMVQSNQHDKSTAPTKKINIKNNYFYDNSGEILMAPQTIASEGSGVIIENNTFHYSQGSAFAAGWDSYENIFSYNECYNLMQQRSDIGAVYSGRCRFFNSNEFAYNYFYDYDNKSPFIDGGTQGIYMDDCYAGATIHHNIMTNGGYSGIQIGGGHDNNVYDNIILNMPNVPILTDNRGETWVNTDWKSMFYPHIEAGLASRRTTERNPGLWDTYKNTEAPLNNKIMNNVSDGKFVINDRFRELGIVDNNQVVSGYTDFVDPENGDYRIRSDSKLAAQLPEAWTEKGYDIYNVGAQLSVINKLSDTNTQFKLLYPLDKDKNVNGAKAELIWEDSDTADCYTVTIAEDPQMKNIVETLKVTYNWAVPTKLETGEKTYYWTVEAENTGFKSKRKWNSKNQPFSFVTSEYDIVDYAKLGHKIGKLKSLSDVMTEATYEKNAILTVKKAIEEADKVYEMQYGTITNELYNNVLSGIDSAVSLAEKSRVYTYVPLDEQCFTNLEKWATNGNADVSFDDGIKFTPKNGAGIVNLKEKHEFDKIYSFSAKINFNKDPAFKEGNFATFDLCRGKPELMAWSDIGYMVIIKQHKIELQKYSNAPGGIVETAMNSIAGDEKWHDYSFGVLKENGFYRLVFRIDGITVFDWCDYIQDLSQGYMSFGLVNLNDVSMRKSISDTSGSVGEQIFGIKSLFYAESGEWTDCESGVNGKKGRQSKDPSAVATWEITPTAGKYDIYYWVDPSKESSSSATLKLKFDYIKTQEGEEKEETYTIDFENSSAGWQYLCTEDVKNGTVTAVLSDKSTKKITASALRFVKAK